MTRVGVAALVAACACGCNSPSKASIAAYRSAQRAALERVMAQEKSFATSLAEVRAGRWTPRADLGTCASTLPPPPTSPEDWSGYPGWVVDSPNAESIAGWNHLSERVFKRLREPVGDPDSDRLPETEKDTTAGTARLAAIDPSAEGDIFFLYVDEIHRPVQTGEDKFAPGDERGRAWVWSQKSKTIVCASTFASHTPDEVIAQLSQRPDPDRRAMQVDSALMSSLRHDSIRSAATTLAAAGPPK
jgi:hypothetical protein